MQQFNIRAEFADKTYKDFTVNAESLDEAWVKAQAKLIVDKNLQFSAKFDWRGSVVFVGHSPSI